MLHKPYRSQHKHQPEKKEKRLYDSQRWRKLSRLYLQKNPLCVMCKAQGVINPAVLVDHITPHRNNLSLFWNEANYQSLCNVCHSTKTIAETHGTTALHKQMNNSTPCLIVCGPVGSGRHDYAKARMNKGDVLVSAELIVQSLFGVGWLDAEEKQCNIAIAERNRQLATLDASGCVYIVAQAPTVAERDKLRQAFTNARVAVLLASPNDCVERGGEKARKPAELWWKRYKQGRDEQTVGYG
ncbi:MAG: HNH endonuclease signature motif containing protein [Shewanella sp.]